MTETHFYNLGKRDALIGLFMFIRDKGQNSALKEIAQALKKADPENNNCHIEWYLKTVKENEI